MARVTPVNVQVPDLPTAPIIADFVEHALRIAYVHRRDLGRLPDAEWSSPGVYVLIADDGSRRIRVGQAVRLRARLHQHRSKPPFEWDRAIAIKRDTSHGFNSAEIGYLEGRLTAELDAVSRLTVVKGKVDLDATLPTHMLLSLDALLPSMIAAIRLAGVDVSKDEAFVDSGAESADRGPRTHTVVRGTVADLLAAGLLQAGAELHLSQGGRSASGTVNASGEIIVRSVAYGSPSRAAATALGLQSSNGWDTWHVGNLSGPTLSALRSRLEPDELESAAE